MTPTRSKNDIILASASPRRRELLKKIVPEFRVEPSQADESGIDERDPAGFALAAAILKAREAGKRFPSSIVLAADTVVALDGRIFGKPANRADARKTLKTLSGRRHKVITAVALYCRDRHRLMARLETSFVRFRKIDDRAIESYLDTGSHADKAGSYAIQELNGTFIESYEGDYDNIVGLPVELVKEMLDTFLSPRRPLRRDS
jgi:septum formation protein